MMVKRLQLTHANRSHRHSVRAIICDARLAAICSLLRERPRPSIWADEMSRVRTADIDMLPALVRSLGALAIERFPL